MRLTAFQPGLIVGLAAVVLAMLGQGIPAARATEQFRVHGVAMPSGAVRLGDDDDRYRLTESFDVALKWFRGVYRPEKFPRKLIVNQPGIKAVHIANPDRDAEWEGFNLYVYQGETRLYILEREKK